MADGFGQLSDRELLVQIATDVSSLKMAVYGDGRPGLIELTAANAARIGVLDEATKDFPTVRDRHYNLENAVSVLQIRTKGLITAGCLLIAAVLSTIAMVVSHHLY